MIRRGILLAGLLGLVAARGAETADPVAAPAAVSTNAPAWREDFRTWNKAWEIRGKPGTAKAEFKVAPRDGAAEGDGGLLMTADQASASLLIPIGEIDLKKTPVLRWAWSVLTLPEGADGREGGKDDQAIGIYVATGGRLSQRSVAYRWETATPVGAEGDARYAGGIAKIHWFALRNATNGTNTVFVEERNLAEDFQKAYGEVPAKIALSVSCNSQYTGTKAGARLDWIEIR